MVLSHLTSSHTSMLIVGCVNVGRPILAAAGFLPGVLWSAPDAEEPPRKAAAAKIACPTRAGW